jgi:nicotinate-nucleotide--dimethylbenzimidazole phosphoribosyltransferase
MQRLTAMLDAIRPLDRTLLQQARDRLDRMAIPRGSLGRLEECAQRVAGIRETLTPSLGKKAIAVFAGDHGVVEEGVSLFAGEVTPQMVYNFVRGGAGINVLARQVGRRWWWLMWAWPWTCSRKMAWSSERWPTEHGT